VQPVETRWELCRRWHLCRIMAEPMPSEKLSVVRAAGCLVEVLRHAGPRLCLAFASRATTSSWCG